MKLTRERPMTWFTQSTTLARRNIHRLYARHTRNIDNPPRLIRTRTLQQQGLHAHRHIKDILNIQIIQLIPRMLGVIIIIVAPARARVVHQHSQPVNALRHLFAQRDAPGFVFQIRDNIFACPWAKRVESRGRGFQLGFFARGDEDARPVLNKGLRGHFAEACGATGYEDDVRGEVEEGGDAEVVFGSGVRHGGGGACVEVCCGWGL
jgi:hypothetical protein